MKLAQTSTLLICLLGAPGISLAADAKGDVEKAYAAWDAAFNKHDEKAIGASYVATAKLMPPTHQSHRVRPRSRSSLPDSSRAV